MSEAVNATALKSGEATIEVKIRANYSKFSKVEDYVTIAKVIVVDSMLTLIPTYVSKPYTTTPLLLIPPNANYKINIRKDPTKLKFSLLSC